MIPWATFLLVFSTFLIFGAALFMVSTTFASGALYFIAFMILGSAAGQKAYNCVHRGQPEVSA